MRFCWFEFVNQDLRLFFLALKRERSGVSVFIRILVKRAKALSLAFAFLAVCATFSATRAVERVTMPYTCVVKDGVVDLQRSEPITYPIEGKRQERISRMCSRNRMPSDIRDCRVMVLHRFALSCGGRSVDWMTIAAAMPRGEGVVRAWLKDDVLNLALKPRWRAMQSKSKRVLVHAVSSRELPHAHFVFPKLFAPLEQFGARLVSSSGLEDAGSTIGDVIVPPEPSFLRVALSNLDRQRGSSPLHYVQGYEAVTRGGVKNSGRAGAQDTGNVGSVAKTQGRRWDTIIITGGESLGPISDVGWSRFLTTALGLLLFVLVAFSTFSFALKPLLRNLSARELSEMNAEGSSGPSFFKWFISYIWKYWTMLVGNFGTIYRDLTMRNGVGSVEAQIEQVASLVSALDKAPLRETLEKELESIEQRLVTLKSSKEGQKGGKGFDRRNAATLRNIVRELSRIRRIVESAAVSVMDHRQQVFMPQTRSEAFQVLGVNANASSATLKKVIDGLRMSWHPDLARSDEDRELCNERIKQINRAWELVAQKSCAGRATARHI